MKTYLQKKLTGLPGQVVGFDEQGQAEAQYPKGGFVAQLQVTVMRGEASGAVTLTAVCGARRVEQVIPEGSSRTVLEISAYGLWTVTAQAQTGQLLRPSREIRVDTVRQYPVLLGGFEELGKNPPAVIREACENGLARSYWKVGDSISIPLSDGGTAVMQIYDYDHDTLAQGGRALITFGSKYLVNESLHHNAPLTLRTTNERGWSSSGIRNYLKGEFWESLPEEWRDLIRPVKKLTSGGGSREGTIAADEDRLFLFCEEEVFGSSRLAADGEGKLYSVFLDGANRKKTTPAPEAMASSWYLRSPVTKHESSSDRGKYYCAVNSTGTVMEHYQHGKLCFGFCL